MVNAGKLTIFLDANTAGLASGLTSAKGQIATFGSLLKSGLVSAAAFAGKAITGIGITATIAGTAIATKGIVNAAKFEKQLADVATLLDGDVGPTIDNFQTKVLEMSSNFGEGTGTLTKGLYDIISASIPAEDALGVLEVSAKAASAGVSDTGTAADAITTILNSYGLEAKKAGDVSDWLFTIVKKGKITFPELAQNIGQVASLASSAGMDLDTLGATISTLTRAGIQAPKAMTAVRSILSTIMKPTEDSAKAFQELGFDIKNFNPTGENLIKLLTAISKSEKSVVAEAFPNIRAMTGIAAAMQNVTGLGNDMVAMQERAGITQEAFSKQADTLSFQLGRLKQGFSNILTTEGLGIIDSFREIVDSLLAQLPNLQASFAPIFTSVAKAITPLSSIVVSLLSNIGPIATIIIDAFSQLAPYINILIEKTGAFVAELLEKLMPVFEKLVLYIEPLIDVFFKIVDAAMPLVDIFLQITEILIDSGLLDIIVSVLNTVADLLKLIMPLFTPIIEGFAKLFNLTMKPLYDIIIKISDAIAGFANNDIVKNVIGGIGNLIGSGVEKINTEALTLSSDKFLNSPITKSVSVTDTLSKLKVEAPQVTNVIQIDGEQLASIVETKISDSTQVALATGD